MGDRLRVGLALAGGIVRGPVHAGVLATLQRADIPVDCIAGTSFGALAGAMYCAGLDGQTLCTLVRAIRWRRGMRPEWPGLGLFSMDKLEQTLTRILGDLRFEDLTPPLAVVTADLLTGEMVVLRRGRLAPALRASCSLPGLVAPLEYDDCLLVDGAIANNLPVSVVRQMGADYVIAVDVAQAGGRPDNPAAVLLTALGILIRRAGDPLASADCAICPTVPRSGGLFMPDPEPLVELGRQAAEAALPAIREALQRQRG